ncbi:hypothetical protein DSM03_11723 [Leeuwenhoekiella aestuarii]|uniref:hypothetical protein n=1 Tax=Leeuwenhoekiella aestuarii TaxID=2249426 RepID=UPI000FFE4588|nr:hypothetical protein [Leeuwenhoekiella aestuarii]RXG11386.1 hypothetical protein DSM03_11723 [Leeuwenhoekiella aestuarii]
MRNYLVLVLLLISIVSCEDIISVTDISQDRVVVLAPQNDTQVTTSSVNFSWEPVDFANAYTIQVSSPDFETASQILLDTTLIEVDSLANSRYMLNTTLNPGNYSWRIKASNSGYATAYSTQKFSVSENASLIGQRVELLSPEDNQVFTSTTINFSWESINAATLYRFELTNSDTDVVIVSETFSTSNTQYTFEESATYTWKVRAENDRELTEYTERTVEIDLE